MVRLLIWFYGWRQDLDGWWVRARRETDPWKLPSHVGFVEEACVAVRTPRDAYNLDKGIIIEEKTRWPASLEHR